MMKGKIIEDKGASLGMRPLVIEERSWRPWHFILKRTLKYFPMHNIIMEPLPKRTWFQKFVLRLDGWHNV